MRLNNPSEVIFRWLARGGEFSPTADTEFSKDETLVAYFEIKQPLASQEPSSGVRAHLRIVDAHSGQVADDFEPVDAAPYVTANNKVIPMARGISLGNLSAGEYQLEVQATDSGGNSTPWRIAEFTVRPSALEVKTSSPVPKQEEVIVNLSVLDSDGHAVTDLTNADFQILDEEKPQAITSFKVTSAPSLPVPQELTIPEGRPQGSGDTDRQASGPRIVAPPIVILFDLMNTTWSTREYVANRLIKVLTPLKTDEGIYLYLLTPDGEVYPVRPHGTGQAVAIKQGSTTAPQDAEKPDGGPWTKDIRRLLLDKINEVHGFRDEDYRIDAWRAPFTFRRLSELEDDFAAVTGPKTFLWITGGVPTTVRSYCENDVISSAMGTYASGTCISACELPNVLGMVSELATCMDFTPFFAHFSAEAAASDTTVSSVALTATGLQDFDIGKSASSLARLADLTGGRIYMNTDTDIERAIHDALEAVKGRYRLSFATPVPDGKYHRLRILCKRSGSHVAGPRGYLAARRDSAVPQLLP
jgi:VWFA-related protein